MLSFIAGMMGKSHHAQLFSIEVGSPKLFYLCWLGTMIFPISASYVAEMTGSCHGIQLLVKMESH
jgi:hypothetical protein